MFTSRGMKFTITVALRSTTRQTCRAPRRTCSWSFSVRLSLSLASTPCAPRSSWVRRQWGSQGTGDCNEQLLFSADISHLESHMAWCIKPAVSRDTCENLVYRELLLKDEQLISCRYRNCYSFSSLYPSSSFLFHGEEIEYSLLFRC